jgi:hypothetical protein
MRVCSYVYVCQVESRLQTFEAGDRVMYRIQGAAGQSQQRSAPWGRARVIGPAGGGDLMSEIST